MKSSVSLWRALGTCAVVAASVFTLTQASAGTLDNVRKNKKLMCGANGTLQGFGFADAKGEMQGFDADFCRALAAALNVDVGFKALNASTRFTALQSGEVDLLSRNTTWNLTRDTQLALDFVGVTYYDGQGFMVNKKTKVKSARELDGASICVQTGTTTEQNLQDYFKRIGKKYKPVVFEKQDDATAAYASGRCDALTTDASGLAGIRSGLKNADEHLILPEIISKEPLGPVVRHGDNAWADVVRWVYFALVTAEEKGITKDNVKNQSNNPDPEVKRMLGFSGNLHEFLGLDKDWAVRAIGAVGNYGEMFERNLGEKTPLRLDRHLNALWNKGGLIYSPPFN